MAGTKTAPEVTVLEITQNNVALGLVDAEKKLSHIVITNNSDGDYAVSFDGVNENYRVLANTYKVIDFDGANVDVTVDLYMKWVTAPSLGSVIIEAYYYV